MMMKNTSKGEEDYDDEEHQEGGGRL